jgi:hypothetical protein
VNKDLITFNPDSSKKHPYGLRPFPSRNESDVFTSQEASSYCQSPNLFPKKLKFESHESSGISEGPQQMSSFPARQESGMLGNYFKRLQKYKEENENLRRMVGSTQTETWEKMSKIIYITLGNKCMETRDKQNMGQDMDENYDNVIFENTQKTMFDSSPEKSTLSDSKQTDKPNKNIMYFHFDILETELMSK